MVLDPEGPVVALAPAAMAAHDIKDAFDRAMEGKRFSMPGLCAAVWPHLERHSAISSHIPPVRRRLGDAFGKLQCSILRNAFLIELVQLPKVETTKMTARWSEDLAEDPRGCSFEECLAIAADLMQDLHQGWLDDGENLLALQLSFSCGLIPYEAPIDYIDRPAIYPFSRVLPTPLGPTGKQGSELVFSQPIAIPP